MHFEITHEVDAPLEAVEKAVLSPELGERLGKKLKAIESVETIEHVVKDGVLERVLRFQASAPLSIFKGQPLAREAMAWHEHVTYRTADHASRWQVKTTREQWEKWFGSEGTYHLERTPDGRTRRVVHGDLSIRVKVLGAVAERMALAEVRRTYDAEAEVLGELAKAVAS